MTKISLNLYTRNASHSLTHTQGKKLLGLIFFCSFLSSQKSTKLAKEMDYDSPKGICLLFDFYVSGLD